MTTYEYDVKILGIKYSRYRSKKSYEVGKTVLFTPPFKRLEDKDYTADPPEWIDMDETVRAEIVSKSEIFNPH